MSAHIATYSCFDAGPMKGAVADLNIFQCVY